MDCPRCKLINPDIAQRCDCGYDFETKTVEKPYGKVEETNTRLRDNLIGLGIFMVAAISATWLPTQLLSVPSEVVPKLVDLAFYGALGLAAACYALGGRWLTLKLRLAMATVLWFGLFIWTMWTFRQQPQRTGEAVANSLVASDLTAHEPDVLTALTPDKLMVSCGEPLRDATTRYQQFVTRGMVYKTSNDSFSMLGFFQKWRKLEIIYDERPGDFTRTTHSPQISRRNRR